MKRRKIIALLLSFMLLFSLLPNGAAWAEDQDGVETSSPSDADEGQDIDSIDEEGLDTDKVEGEIQDVVTTDTENQDTVNQPVIRSFNSRNLANTLLRNAANYTLEFTVLNGTNHTISKDGDRLRIDGGIVELHDSNNTEIQVTVKVPDDAHATMTVPAGSEGYLNFGGNNFTLYANGDPFSMDTKITGAMQFAVQDYVNPGGQGGDQPAPGAGGDSEAIIRLTGPDGNWECNPIVWEQYDNIDGDTCSAPYSKYCYTTVVGINGSNKTQGLNQYHKDANLTGFAEQTVRFDKEETADTVTINLSHNWSNKITYLKINGDEYTDQLPNYADRYTWLSHYNDQGFDISIGGVPLPMPTDPYYDNERNIPIFNIEIMVQPIEANECYVGNFLWSNDDAFAPDGDNSNDLYIGHSKLVLQSAVFDDGDGSGDKSWTLDVNDNGQSAEYNYTDASGNVLPYVHLGLNRENFETHAKVSEMLIPAGSKVTMTITPEPGYQVVDFTGVDFDDGSVQLPGGQCVYTFTVGKGNFHLGAKVEKVENDSEVASKVVKKAGIAELPEGVIDAGTARLYVADAELSAAKEAAFEAEAAKEGLAIEDVLDVSLAQVFFKGNGDADDVWANPKEDLEEPALLGIQLEGDYTGKDVEFIHNIHDGEAFETIEPVEFDRANNIVYFEVDSFSSYAIATKPITAETPKDETKEATVTPAKKAEVKSTKPATADNFNIMLIGAIAIVSAAGIVFVVRRKRMIGK